MNKIILVTGGAGFIGSNLIRYLLSNYPNYRVINFDLLSFGGHLSNLVDIEENPNYIFIKGNVGSYEALKNLFEQFLPEYVVHLASETNIKNTSSHLNIAMSTNIIGSQNVINACISYNVKKIVMLSSGMIYGKSKSPEIKYKETDNLVPMDYYSAGKAASDILAQTSYKVNKLPINIIRSCSIYGMFQSPSSLIPFIIQNALKDKEIPVYEDSSVLNSWIHVKDVCRAIDLVLHNAEDGEEFNIGTSDVYSNVDLVNLILKKMNKSQSLIKNLSQDKNSSGGCILDTTKILDYLGWSPQVDFEKGLQETIEWYLTHQKWVEEVMKIEFSKSYKSIYEGSL